MFGLSGAESTVLVDANKVLRRESPGALVSADFHLQSNGVPMRCIERAVPTMSFEDQYRMQQILGRIPGSQVSVQFL